MFIAETVISRSKLRQERHGNGHPEYSRSHRLNRKHAAPDGAWLIFGGAVFYKHGAPTELAFPIPIPPRTIKLLTILNAEKLKTETLKCWITLLQEAQLEFLAAISHCEAEQPGLGQRFKDEARNVP